VIRTDALNAPSQPEAAFISMDQVESEDKKLEKLKEIPSKSTKTSREEEDRRMAICEGCEFLKRPAKQCSKCGCFMKLKTKLERGHCPIHKW
jgi:hypothetical protein